MRKKEENERETIATYCRLTECCFGILHIICVFCAFAYADNMDSMQWQHITFRCIEQKHKRYTTHYT